MKHTMWVKRVRLDRYGRDPRGQFRRSDLPLWEVNGEGVEYTHVYAPTATVAIERAVAIHNRAAREMMGPLPIRLVSPRQFIFAP